MSISTSREKKYYSGRNVRIDDETYERIKTLSKEEGRTHKEIIKRALLEYWYSVENLHGLKKL